MDGLKPALDALAGFGTAAPAMGLLLWLFWAERTERREANGKLMQVTVDAIKAASEMTQALETLAGKLGK